MTQVESGPPQSRVWMEAFAEEWITNWNARDVQAIVGHMSEDAVFVSPVAAEVTGSHRVVGRPALIAYWQAALERTSSLRFLLDRAVCDVSGQTLVVLYTSERNGATRRAAELMQFEAGRQVYGEALYGAGL